MINIKYLEKNQTCRIETDNPDKNWVQLKFQYSQITDQSSVAHTYIELPWHSFISNLDILNFAKDFYHLTITIDESAAALIDESKRIYNQIEDIDSLTALTVEEIRYRLNTLGFVRNPTPQQLRNIVRLSRLPFGATFSVPGAGKTTEAIAFYLLHKKPGQGLLVICPKNAFPAWEEQFQLCLGTSAPRVVRLSNGEQNILSALNENSNTVFLISYQQFRLVTSLIATYIQKHTSFIFIDESHRMKGGDRVDIGRQVQRVSHLAVGKLVMSGTPMPNSTSDLIPQYSFLFPSDGEVDSNNVISKIKSIYVRTTKDEILNPEEFPITTIKTEIPFNEPQKKLYNLIRSEELRINSKVSKIDARILRQLNKSYMRLLQVTSNPSLLMKSMDTYPDALRETIEYGDSNKIRYTVLKARQLAKEGKKLLIWSGFVENIESITMMLSDLGARCIHGKVESGDDFEQNTRESIVKEFHDDPHMFVLVANPAACSEGISLHTVCHHAIYLDRNYNASQYLQSRDRIHRIGLQSGTETIIEIVHTPGSIDDLIDTRLNVKINRMADVLQDPSIKEEAVTVDMDVDAFDEEDARLYLSHLKELL